MKENYIRMVEMKMKEKKRLEEIEMKYDWGIETKQLDYNLEYADISFLLSLAKEAEKYKSTLKMIAENSMDLTSVKKLANRSLDEISFHPLKQIIEDDDIPFE